MTTKPPDGRLAYFTAWTNPKAQHGLSHNPKLMDSNSQAVVPKFLPSQFPKIPELCSGDLDDPATPYDLDVANGAVAGGMHLLLHHPNPMTGEGEEVCDAEDELEVAAEMALEAEEKAKKAKKEAKKGAKKGAKKEAEEGAEEGAEAPKAKTRYLALVGAGVFPPIALEGGSLYERFQRGDTDAMACIPPELGDPAQVVQDITTACQVPAEPRACGQLKQIYFPVAPNQFHVLGVAGSSLLMVRWRRRLRRFGQKGRRFPCSLHLSFGGAQPQNVGTLASRFRGVTLLANIPPQHKTTRLPYNTKSLFQKWTQQLDVCELFHRLEKFLVSDYKLTRRSRLRHADHVDAIVESLLRYRSLLRAQPGWTNNPGCLLSPAQREWVDPAVPQTISEADLLETIGQSFALVAASMLKTVPHGVAERNAWKESFVTICRFGFSS